MFRKEYVSKYLTYGILAAVLFCLPMIYFVNSADYRKTWLLFLGNVFFLVVICVFLLSFNKMKFENTSTQNMVVAGHLTTLTGIVISCIVAAITIAFFSPSLSGDIMVDAPSQTGTGSTHGLIFFVFMNSIIGNLAGGSFASVIVPYTAKKNQTKDQKSEVVNN